MEAFLAVRLSYYDKRKAFLATKLSEEWEKLDNKVRFILAVIQGELVVSNRKKSDILEELQEEGYQTFFPVKKNAQAGGDAVADNEEGEESPDEAEPLKLDRGYDYLLSMKLWSLTMEKVQELCKERDNKRDLLDTLLAKPGRHLWLEDLDALEDALDMFEEAIVQEEEEERKAVRKATKASTKPRGCRAGGHKAATKRGKQRRKHYSDESDDEEELEDEDSDYEVSVKSKAKSGPRAPHQSLGKRNTASSAAPVHRIMSTALAVTVPAKTRPAAVVKKVAVPVAPPVEEDMSTLSLLDRMKQRMMQQNKAAATKQSSAATTSRRATNVVDLRDDSDSDDAYQLQDKVLFEPIGRAAVSRPVRTARNKSKVYTIDSEEDSHSESAFESGDSESESDETYPGPVKAKQSAYQKKSNAPVAPSLPVALTHAKTNKRVVKGSSATVPTLSSPVKPVPSSVFDYTFSPGVTTPPETKKPRKQNSAAADRMMSLVLEEDARHPTKGPAKKPSAPKRAPAPKKGIKRIMDSDENDDDEFLLAAVTLPKCQKPARSTRKVVKSYVFDEEESDSLETDDDDSDFSG